ncbi:MAG: GTPase Era [Eubacteriaceae bacterium]|nr:GTPase Era [Eubacteriaceae bacterium]
MDENYRSGFISVIGRTNVGKSSLLNSMIGQKVSIVSDKPQTTRNIIRLILTTQTFQMVFLDAPGFHMPKTRLSENMVKSATRSMNGVDAILFVVENDLAIGRGDMRLIESLQKRSEPVILAINKIDKIPRGDILKKIELFKDYSFIKAIVPVSALNGDNVSELVKTLYEYMPEGPMYFPEGMLTDRAERFFVSEIIREKALLYLRDEIPHGIAIDIEKFEPNDQKGIIGINAAIYARKSSHKGIIIGKGGATLKKIASAAREGLEDLLGTKVFLSLYVKVKEGWQDSARDLAELGYRIDE